MTEESGDPTHSLREPEVRVRVELTEQDVVDGFRAIPAQRNAPLAIALFGAVFLVHIWGGSTDGIYKVLAASGVGLILLFAVRMGMRRGWRRAYNTMSVAGGIEYTFTPGTVEINTAKANSRFRYDGLYRYHVTKTTLLLYTSSQVAQIVPVRAFTQDELASVRGWLDANVKKASRVPGGLRRMLALWVLLIVAFLAVWLFLAPDP